MAVGVHSCIYLLFYVVTLEAPHALQRGGMMDLQEVGNKVNKLSFLLN